MSYRTDGRTYNGRTTKTVNVALSPGVFENNSDFFLSYSFFQLFLDNNVMYAVHILPKIPVAEYFTNVESAVKSSTMQFLEGVRRYSYSELASHFISKIERMILKLNFKIRMWVCGWKFSSILYF